MPCHINETLSISVIIALIQLLLRAGDVELNPGPRTPRFPCGECGKACTAYKGAKSSIFCDECHRWFHADCVNLSEDLLACLSRSDIPWVCPNLNCGLPNISTSLFNSVLTDTNASDSMTSDRSSTSSYSSSEPGSPTAHSSPSKTAASSNRRPANLRTLSINFQSIHAKKVVFWNLIEAAKPDVIFGSETWLKPNITHGEVFPPDYNLYRKDARDGYGGVLLGIHNSLTSHQIDLDSDAEMVAAKIVNGKQHIVVGAIYRRTDNNCENMNLLNQTSTLR